MKNKFLEPWGQSMNVTRGSIHSLPSESLSNTPSERTQIGDDVHCVLGEWQNGDDVIGIKLQLGKTLLQFYRVPSSSHKPPTSGTGETCGDICRIIYFDKMVNHIKDLR